MKSGWVDRDAKAMVAGGAKAGIDPDVSLRIYTTRLLGRDPKLVLHGGGNTSLKTTMRDLLGAEVEVLRVKASGADMASIEPAGFPALRLEPMRKLRALAAIDDEELVGVERANLIDPRAPNPSVEVMVHAFLPHKFIDHTHATAVLSVIDQPRSEQICAEVFGERMAFVPYLLPGFGLAKKAIEVFERAPDCEGLILSKHGLVTFGETAREAYERMIAFVSHAEDFIARNRKSVAAAQPARRPPPVAEVAPIVRGVCSEKDDKTEGAWRRLVLEFCTSNAIVDFLERKDLARKDLAQLSEAGVITPDHTIRTKNWPLLLNAPEPERMAEFAAHAREKAQEFTTRYRDYFARHNKRAGGNKTPLDPLPRVALVPGLGLFGLGRTRHEAVMFDCEYWPLEQAKLGARQEPPLAGQVAAITGAAGAIGAATAKYFAAAGAEVALLDVDRSAAREEANAVGPHALALACDVTDAGSVSAAFAKIAEHFGGVDIVVSNAGAAWQGRIGEVDEDILHKSFELNFYGHQRVAQAAVRIMRAQGTGGCLLFNISKQAVNPGANFGPYGIPKAAALALMRQYALDYGADGIRANAVNADRIRSGLLTPQMIASRAKARGVSEKDYMTGNLLGREVDAEDVALAFLHQALALKTTADVTTVDGGNIAAAMR